MPFVDGALEFGAYEPFKLWAAGLTLWVPGGVWVGRKQGACLPQTIGRRRQDGDPLPGNSWAGTAQHGVLSTAIVVIFLVALRDRRLMLLANFETEREVTYLLLPDIDPSRPEVLPVRKFQVRSFL